MINGIYPGGQGCQWYFPNSYFGEKKKPISSLNLASKTLFGFKYGGHKGVKILKNFIGAINTKITNMFKKGWRSSCIMVRH